ncbi:MAG: peptidoglycan DD-metalloendopeptidase family protein [Polyangiaceae bacterium]|nr:peptidoglycan DD-metalloendopeptidase family protein [Polyangiaceae bacterium]
MRAGSVICLASLVVAAGTPHSVRAASTGDDVADLTSALADASSGPAASAPLSTDPAELGSVLAELDRNERRLQSERSRLSQQIKQAEARRLLCGRAYVKATRAGLLPLGGGVALLADWAARVERLRQLLARDTSRERYAVQRHTQISAKLDELRRSRTSLEAQRDLVLQARSAMLQAHDRALAFERAFLGSAHTAVYGAGVGPSDPSDVAGTFASLKGRLPFPIPGRAEIATVRRRGAGGTGLEMRVERGSPVRCVYAGRVAYADRYADYGKTVIIDHGGGYFTVSANLEAISVSVGDELSSLARIGTVGDRGDGPMMYFEIRAGSELLDPAPWFGI